MQATSSSIVGLTHLPTDAGVRPLGPVSRAALTAVPAVVGATGLLAPSSYNLLPATTVLEVTFIAVAAVAIPRIRPNLVPFAALIAFVLMVRFTVILLGATAPLVDALQAHKWMLFLLLLTVLVGRGLPDVRWVDRVTVVLVVLALAKYVLVVAMEGFRARPGLLTENNYEAALLAGLVAVSFPRLGRRRLLVVLALGVVVALSGSRSGAVAFLIVAAYVAVSSGMAKRALGLFVSAVGVLGAVWFVVTVFIARAQSSLFTIDRINFLGVFWSETRDWGLLEWIVGTTPITPLSPTGCSTLAYYELLFANPDEGICYAVILHAFVLRVVFDTGILGLLLAFGGLIFVMRAAGIERRLGIALVAIALANSLSVSGLNNIYVVWPIAIAILTAGSAPALRRPGGERDAL